MTEIEALQNWYLSQCNEDWEHTYGIKIETLDNPGWSLSVELTDTEFDGIPYAEFSYGVGDDAKNSGHNWLITKIESGKFVGYGGPHKLEEIIQIFLAWVKSHA